MIEDEIGCAMGFPMHACRIKAHAFHMGYIGSSTETRQENGATERKLTPKGNVETIYFSFSFSIIHYLHPSHSSNSPQHKGTIVHMQL